MNKISSLIIATLSLVATTGCTQSQPINKNYDKAVMERFGTGAAEIAVYDLEQNRYNDVHSDGTFMSIWVTEDFLTDKQVKDEGISKGSNTTVLKNIQRRLFTTGLYDYSMMHTTFTPIDRTAHPHTLKMTLSSQDWCGHSFSQINMDGRQYKSKLLSYFESEGDTETKFPLAVMEDEIFNLIRMDVGLIPQGKMEVIPSAVYVRLTHIPHKPYSATVNVSNYTGSDFKGGSLKMVSITYPDFQRQLEIVFDEADANTIVGWTDTYPSIFDRQPRTTKATLRTVKKLDYWNKHSADVVAFRQVFVLK